MIFSHVLYQLSYLGICRRARGLRGGRFIGAGARSVQRIAPAAQGNGSDLARQQRIERNSERDRQQHGESDAHNRIGHAQTIRKKA